MKKEKSQTETNLERVMIEVDNNMEGLKEEDQLVLAKNIIIEIIDSFEKKDNEKLCDLLIEGLKRFKRA